MAVRIRVIETAQRGGLVVRERNGVTELLTPRGVLLSSAALETEREFGRVVVEALPTRAQGGRLLVGGLGFGATVRGILDVAPPDARILVVERVAEVVALVRDELADFAGRVLDDPRVTVEIGDVAQRLAASRAAFDAILLDVDNGPDWASFPGNARLYTDAGVASAREALAPDGVFAVWSGYPAEAFTGRLRRAGLEPTVTPLRERGRVRARAYMGRLRP